MSSVWVEKDADARELPMSPTKCPTLEEGGSIIDKDTRDNTTNKDIREHQTKQLVSKRRNPRLPSDDEYRLHNLRYSEQV